MAAGNLDLMFEQGGSFELVLDVFDDAGLPFVLTGWTPSMRIVHRASGVVTYIASGISVSSSSINIFIASEIIDDFDPEDSDYTPRQIKHRDTKYAYDIKVTNGMSKKKIVRGNILVVRDI